MGPSPGGIAVWWRNRFCGGAQGWALISSVGCMKGANCAGQVAFSLRRLAWGQVLNIMVGAVAKYGFLESGPKISSK